MNDITNNNNNSNNDNFEILFWKVVNNKILFKLIFHHITAQQITNSGYERYFSYDNVNVKKYLENKIKFKNITSLEWMVQNNQIQLLLYKLKNDEYIKVSKKSLGELTNYFNKKISTTSTTTSTPATTNTNSESDLLKEILILLLKNKLLNNEGHLRELLTSNGPTFKLILQVFDQTKLQLSKHFKNNLIYEILNYNYHSIETLLKYKKLYNVPQISTNKKQQQQVKMIEIGSGNLKEISMSTKLKLIEFGFIDFGYDQHYEFYEKLQNLIDGGNGSKNEKEILKLLSIYISTPDWYPIYYSKYQEPIDELLNNPDSINFILQYTVYNYKFQSLKWCLLNEIGNGAVEFENYQPNKPVDFQKDIDFINLYTSQDKIHWYSTDFSILKSIDSIEKYSTMISSSSLSDRFKNKLPKSWNEIIPLLCNFKDDHDHVGVHHVVIDQIETIDWIIDNQDYMSMNPISFIINSFQVVQYAISKLFISTAEEEKVIPPLNFKIIDGYYRNNNDYYFIQEGDQLGSKSMLYIQPLLQSINRCDIESLKFLNDNNINIDWEPFKEFSLVDTISFYGSNMDESCLINLIDYLNGIGYNNFNGSLFISFTNSIKSTFKSLYERIKIPNQFINLLNDQSIQDLELSLFNNENNPIEILAIFNYQIFDEGLLPNVNFENILKLGCGTNGKDEVRNIQILIKFYNTTMKTNQQDILLACKSAINSLFDSLLRIRNLPNETLIQVHDEIVNNGITIDHEFHRSIFYLAQKSPNLLLYLIEFYKIGKLQQNEYYKEEIQQFENHFDNGIYTFDWIFKISTADEILVQLMEQSLSIALKPTSNNYNDNVNDPGFYSKVLNLNLNFLLSTNKINLFFCSLNSIQKQLNDCTIEIGNCDGSSSGVGGNGSFPNKIQNYKIDQNYEHEIGISKRFYQYMVKFYNNREKWYHICNGIFERFWVFYHLKGLPKSGLFKKIRYCQSRKPQFFYSLKVLKELCFIPFYKYKDQSLYSIEFNNEEMEMKEKKVKQVKRYQNKYLLLTPYEEEEVVEKEEEVSNNDLAKQHGFYKCSNCNDGLNEIINGRVFYFSVQVYQNAIKILNENDFLEFIKFSSYHSFIHYLYSYGIKVKYLLRYYDLINHVLLNHNDHYFKNNNQIDENIKFITNYWHTVFKYYPLKQKTIIGYEKMVKSNNINSPILIRLLSNYKLKYNDQYYHYDFKHNIELCVNDMNDGFYD